MKQFFRNLPRKTLTIAGVALGLALVSGLGLAAAAALHSPHASATQTSSAQTSSTQLDNALAGDPFISSIPTAQDLGKQGFIARVVSVKGNTLTVTLGLAPRDKNHQMTLTVSSTTKIMEYGQTAKLSDLQANEWIMVVSTKDHQVQQIDILGFAAGGTIQKLTSGGFTLSTKTQSGTATVDVSVSSATTIREAQMQGSASDLQPGESVIVFGDKQSNNTLSARLVQVILISGQVKTIKGNTITLGHGFRGADITVTTSASTKYYLGGKSTSASQLHVGDTVSVAGAVSNKTSVAATSIFIFPHPSFLVGKVTGVNGDMITVQARDGVTWTVTVDSSTKYIKDGKPASLSDVQKGSLIQVFGVKSGNNALTASLVSVFTYK
jgi:Domain of unknown function (DUF5666)